MVKKLHSHEIGWKKNPYFHWDIKFEVIKYQDIKLMSENRELSIKEADVWILFDKIPKKYIYPPSHYWAIGFLDKGAVSL